MSLYLTALKDNNKVLNGHFYMNPTAEYCQFLCWNSKLFFKKKLKKLRIVLFVEYKNIFDEYT